MHSTTTPLTEQEQEIAAAENKVNATLHGQKPNSGQVQVSFSQKALLQIDRHSNSDLTRELGGALLGHALQQNGTSLVKVLASLPVITSDHGPVHFTFTADAWALLHNDKAKEYPGLEIVGWYHTHPNLGVFYSSDDVIVHSAAFVLPWHVGLVIDPIRGEAFLAGWQREQANSNELTLAGINGCYEILDVQETSTVTWRMVQSSVWKQDSYPYDEEELSSQVVAPNSEWPALPPISPWWGVVLGGLSLLISVLLLIERLLANSG